jgi:hypothetical protein
MVSSKGRIEIDTGLIANNLKLIEAGRPELYKKSTKREQ